LNSNNGKVPVTFLGPELYEARYYDPKIGRFYGVDPVGYRDVHSYNRFAYANNNPYKFVDPDGKNPLLLCLIPLGAPACAGVGQFIVDTITVVIGVAGIVDTIQKTTPQKEDKAKGKKVKDRGNPDLPENPDNLVDDGYEETSHSDARKKDIVLLKIQKPVIKLGTIKAKKEALVIKEKIITTVIILIEQIKEISFWTKRAILLVEEVINLIYIRRKKNNGKI